MDEETSEPPAGDPHGELDGKSKGKSKDKPDGDGQQAIKVLNGLGNLATATAGLAALNGAAAPAWIAGAAAVAAFAGAVILGLARRSS